ncbi:MAG: L,D-transpeptidase [Planctomycetes bacterium]|nr:L,D-transpeptidase [Planctomycetota bacterium]
MGKFIAVIVVAALSFAGWKYWWQPRHASAIPGPSATETGLPGPTGAAGGSDGSTAPSNPGGTTAAGDPASPPATGLPANVKLQYEQAEALWKTGELTGSAASSPAAVKLAKLYGEVLKALYNQPAHAAFSQALVDTRLAPLGAEIFFTRNKFAGQGEGLVDVHTVASGENLNAIGKRLGTTHQQLNRMRGKDPEAGDLRANEQLKVLRIKDNGGCLVHIDKSEFNADLFVGGVFVRRYRITHGAVESPTPVGKTKVTNVVFDPPWTSPMDGKVYPPGDPGNILGGVWIALDPEGINANGIGFHGYTGANGGMGKMASNGCIRFENDAIKEVAWLIGIPALTPTAVEIVE